MNRIGLWAIHILYLKGGALRNAVQPIYYDPNSNYPRRTKSFQRSPLLKAILKTCTKRGGPQRAPSE